MASGHEYRANRPNTWLLRPTLQVKILLANPEPSTHGPEAPFEGCLLFRRCLEVRNRHLECRPRPTLSMLRWTCWSAFLEYCACGSRHTTAAQRGGSP